VSPNFGPPGKPFTVSGNGYAAFDTIKIYFGNPRTLLGTATTDGTGSFSTVAFTVPTNAAVGVNRVEGTGTIVPEASNKAPFRVE